MAGHAQLKIVITEYSKTQIRLKGPRLSHNGCIAKAQKRRLNNPQAVSTGVYRSTRRSPASNHVPEEP